MDTENLKVEYKATQLISVLREVLAKKNESFPHKVF